MHDKEQKKNTTNNTKRLFHSRTPIGKRSPHPNCWGVQKSFSSPNDPLCEFLKFPGRVQKIISPQNDTNRDLFKYISS